MPNLQYGKGFEAETPYLCATCGCYDVRMVPELMDDREMYCPDCDDYQRVGKYEKIQ